MEVVLRHCCKLSWTAMMRDLPSTNQTCPATNQVVAGCETLLQTVESSSAFCNKIRACCGFYRPKTNLFRVWRDSRVMLSNQKTVFTELATTWFVVRQVWTWLVKHVTSQTFFGLICNGLNCNYHRDDHIFFKNLHFRSSHHLHSKLELAYQGQGSVYLLVVSDV